MTQKELKKELHYNPETGIFTRKISRNNKVKVGEVAGGKDVNGYIIIRVFGKNYKAHRLAWLYVYGEWPLKEIDHINRDESDNRIKNLRDVSRAVNQQNRFDAKGYSEDYGKYRAQIKAFGETINLGLYETKKEARKAYLKAKKKYHKKALEERK